MFMSRSLSRALWCKHVNTKVLNYARQLPHIKFDQSANCRVLSTAAVEDGYVKKFMRAVGWLDQSRTRLKLCGYFLYESVPDKVKYEDWFVKCNLPDTFNSWFNVTELHVWLLMVRSMAEDETTPNKGKYVKGDGHFIRNCIVEALWADVANRIKLLEGANPAIARRQVSEMSEQFQAALVGYDEGLEDDKVLAAAIWRRMYGMDEDTSPENVEKIVKFVRHQISVLDKMPSLQFKERPTFDWLSIDEK